MKVVTAAEMRAIDREAIQAVGIPGPVLMENAGRGVAEAVRQLPEAPRGVAVLCGKGNNGGDGFVVARYLHQWGFPVRVYLFGAPEEAKGDARIHLAACRAAGVKVEAVAEQAAAAASHACHNSAVVVDALLGTGLSGRVEGVLAEALEAMRANRPERVVAVDIPSGLDSDCGKEWGAVTPADCTVTFAFPKLGHYLGRGPDLCGRLVVHDIGIPPWCAEKLPVRAELLEPAAVADWLKPFARTAHKGVRGKVLLVAGSPGLTGAACLAAEAALRVGAGMAYMVVPRSLNPIFEVKLTEVITLPAEETATQTLAAEALELVESRAQECEAMVVGPGLSRERQTAWLVRQIVQSCQKPLTLDADALNALADDLTPLQYRQAPTILTPHIGEMARLSGKENSEVLFDAVNVARSFAMEHGVIVVLKQARTLIATPQGEVCINSTGNPGMATAGSGDVLSGAIGGLLAQGLTPLQAAAAGVHLHGLAGDMASAALGERSVLAGDILSRLAQALQALT